MNTLHVHRQETNAYSSEDQLQTLFGQTDPAKGEQATEALLNFLHLKTSELANEAVDPNALHYDNEGKLVATYPAIRDEQEQIVPDAPLNQLYASVMTLASDPQVTREELQQLIYSLDELRGEFTVLSETEVIRCLSDAPEDL